jgi:hypothetical protein
MNRYDYLSDDQIRSALDRMELNYELAMDSKAYGLANAFLAKIDGLRDTLTARIMQEQDPYTTEADVRYFEGL